VNVVLCSFIKLHSQDTSPGHAIPSYVMCAIWSVLFTLTGWMAVLFGGQCQSQSSSCYFFHSSSKYFPHYHVPLGV